jgi:cysteine dioxygenase
MANIKNYPDRIRTLINEIEKNNTLTNETLVRILKEQDLAAADFIDFADFIHSPELSYGRTKLYQGLNFVIYLMSWAEGDFTAIHNHGQSDWGAVSFLGNLNHRLYANENGVLKLADKSIIPAGTIVPVKGDLIHAMGNLSQKPSLTLHIYGSDRNLSLPNTTSHIYELEKKRVRITLGEAYIDGFQNIADPIETVVTNEDSLIDYLKIILPFYQRNYRMEMVNYISTVIRNPSVYFAEKADSLGREKISLVL